MAALASRRVASLFIERALNRLPVWVGVHAVFEQKKRSRRIHGTDALAELEGASCVLNIRTYTRTTNQKKPRVTQRKSIGLYPATDGPRIGIGTRLALRLDPVPVL